MNKAIFERGFLERGVAGPLDPLYRYIAIMSPVYKLRYPPLRYPSVIFAPTRPRFTRLRTTLPLSMNLSRKGGTKSLFLS